LLEAFPSKDFPAVLGSSSNAVKQGNIEINEEKAEIYLPVKHGTDLSNFDPKLKLFPGFKSDSEVAKDFNGGPVEYRISNPGEEEKIYNITAEVANNPVLEGYYADPEIIYSNK